MHPPHAQADPVSPPLRPCSSTRVARLVATALVLPSLGCGSAEIKDLKAEVDGQSVVVRGQVADGPVGRAVLVRGWDGDAHVVAEAEPGAGTFVATIPFARLPPGKLALQVAAQKTEYTREALATAEVQVTVPPHAAIGIVACGGEKDSPKPNAGDDPLAAPEASVHVASPAILNDTNGLLCSIRDGAIELSVQGAKGSHLKSGGQSATIADDGRATLRVPVTSWLGTIPLAGFAVKLDPKDGAITWASSGAAVVEPKTITIGVSNGDAKGEVTLTLGSSLDKPVDVDKKDDVAYRVRRLLALARVYFAAARLGALSSAGGDEADDTAALLVPERTADLTPPHIESNVFYFGNATTLADVARFGIATEGATRRIDDCGPYQKVLATGGPGDAITIGRVRVDMNVAAWTRTGDALPHGVLAGGVGCPALTTTSATEDYRDVPPMPSVGAWLLAVKAP